jgi:hypothetical protein
MIPPVSTITRFSGSGELERQASSETGYEQLVYNQAVELISSMDTQTARELDRFMRKSLYTDGPVPVEAIINTEAYRNEELSILCTRVHGLENYPFKIMGKTRRKFLDEMITAMRVRYEEYQEEMTSPNPLRRLAAFWKQRGKVDHELRLIHLQDQDRPDQQSDVKLVRQQLEEGVEFLEKMGFVNQYGGGRESTVKADIRLQELGKLYVKHFYDAGPTMTEEAE